MANPQVVVDFVANTSGLSTGFRQAEGASSGFGSKLKSMAKGAVVAAGAAGIAGLTAAIKIGIDEFSQAQKVTAQTNAVLKSTKGAAGVSSKAVQDLANALMKKSGIDDEAIQSGENLLLTFTNIRNQTGKNNDIFNQATKVMTDMSVALGQDMSSSAVQLGKALNNPVKGITALQRVGVSFTDSQKKTIKSLVDHGKTLEAQKIILGELNKEFGGSAAALGKTLPGQINIAKESFRNFMGELVAKAIPVIQDVIGWLKDHWPEISAAFGAAWATIQPILAALVQDGKAVVQFFVNNWSTIGPIVMGVANIVRAAVNIIVQILKLIAAVITGDWAAAWKQLGAIVQAVWSALVTYVTTEITFLKTIITLAWTVITAVTSAVWNGILALLSAIWSGITSLISGAVNGVKNLLVGAWNAIKGLTSSVWSSIQAFLVGVWAAIQGVASAGANAVRNFITGAWNSIKSITSSIWGSVADTVSNVVGEIKGFITGLANWIGGTAKNLLTREIGGLKAIWNVISDGAEAAVNGVKSAINGLVSFLSGIVGSVSHAASSIANAIKGPINAVIGAWNGLGIPGFSVNINMPGPVPDIHFHFGGVGLPDIPYLAQGGVVSQPTLAMIGEGAGREIVTPESLLRDIVGQQSPEIHVYIGDRELTELVRTEVVDHNTGMARTILAGVA